MESGSFPQLFLWKIRAEKWNSKCLERVCEARGSTPLLLFINIGKHKRNNMSMKIQIHGFLHTGQTTTSLERTTKTEEEKLFSSITMLTDFGFISIWTEFFLHSEGMGTYTVMIDSYVHNRFKSTTFSSKWID